MGASLSFLQTAVAQAEFGGSSQAQPLSELHPLGEVIRSSFTIIGSALLIGVGLIFLLNLECRVTPRISARLPVNLHGFRGGFLAGLLYGAPVAVTCSFIFLLPFIFHTLVTGDMQLSVLQFGLFGLGRTVLIVILGMMMASFQVRLIRQIEGKSRLISIGVGLLLIIFGIYYYFYSSLSIV